MSTDPREFEHPIDGTGGNVPAPTPPLVEVIAEVLAYEHCKRVNPKADHPIMGYHTFHPDQREHLRGVQMDVARAVLAAISEAGAVEWGVRWPFDNDDFKPLEVVSREAGDVTAESLAKITPAGQHPPVVVSRITGPWTAVEG